MADQHVVSADDPFRPRQVWVASIAHRLGCTEGQLYSMTIGLLLAWVVSANGLPHVVWERDDAAGSSFAVPPAEVASGAPNSSPPAAGLLTAAPEPGFSPVTTPEAAAAPPATFDLAPAPAPSEPPAADAGPVAVVSGGFASANAGTPFATVGIPEGSVAVSRRAGGPENLAFLRIRGEGTPLTLTVDPDGVNRLDMLAGLQLCTVIATDWKVGHGDTSLADAPETNCEAPVVGERSDAGDTWTFDISDLDTESIGGVAIVPADDAGAEFQVVFRLAQGAAG